MTIISDATKRAVAYYRHSAEDKQENSVALQREQVEAFARANNIDIVAECIDDGISGITANRPGFQTLLHEWVENDSIELNCVLVLDISRFGRWQNPDEAAMYAFRCYLHGRPVVTVSRGFPKPGEELLYSMADAIERYSAGKYSKDLSDKVWRGQMKITEQGYSAGGSAPYGLKRVLLDEQKCYLQDLRPGQHKVIANQRVTFAPGNPQAVSTVQLIFKMFVNQACDATEIANTLNHRHSTGPSGKPWTPAAIRNILRTDKYCGRTVYNRTSRKLHAAQETTNTRGEWAIGHDAFKPIVSTGVFDMVQTILKLQNPHTPRILIKSAYVDTTLNNTDEFYRSWLQRRITVCISLRQLAHGIYTSWTDSVGSLRCWSIAKQGNILEVYMQVVDLILRRYSLRV